MKGATVVSIHKDVKLEEKLLGETITCDLNRVVTALCEALAYKQKIIGHIKAIVTCDDAFVHVSATSLIQHTTTTSAGWDRLQTDMFTFTLNIIIFGFTKQEIAATAARVLDATIFA